MRPTRWRRSTHVVIGVAVLLLVAGVVGVAAVLTTGTSTSDAEPIKPAPPAATAKPGIVPVADSADKPTPDRLAATLAPLVADPNLGALTGRVTDAMTGAQLWAQGADVPMQPASTNKVLTTAAALLALALKVAPATVTVLPSGLRGGQEIASVQSPPLIERLRQTMNESDNVMAESVGREVAAEQNRPQSFDGAVQAVLSQLDKGKIDTGGARLLDYSGLSIDDRLTAETLDRG